jgi:hypothetical protein
LLLQNWSVFFFLVQSSSLLNLIDTHYTDLHGWSNR